MTIKEKIKQLNDKYKDYIKHTDYFKVRDYWTSGPNTGRGSKGTHYEYTFYTTFIRDGQPLNVSLFANSIDELEVKILDLIKEEVK